MMPHRKPIEATGRLLAAGLTLLALTGCQTVGPDYRQPETAVPARWSRETGQAAGKGALDPAALSQWWTVFGDPVLADLVLAAQAANLDLKQAEARLRQARARRRLATAEQMPSATAGASVTRARSREGLDGLRETTTTYANRIDASWELDLFGGKRRAAESAEASLQAAREDLRDVLASLLAEVALNYVQYRSAQVRLAIVESNLVSRAETHALTRWRQRANLVTQLDVDQARVSLEQTRAEIPILSNTLAETEHQLATLLGQPPDSLRPRLEAGPAAVPAASHALAVGVPADALRQRPDVRRAERNLAARTAQIGVAAAERYPDFSLSGSIGLEALALGDLYDAGASAVQGVAQAGLTLFDGGRIRQNVAVQTALQEEALSAYEATVLSALQEVEDALSAYASQSARETALSSAAAAAQEAFQLARDQYASGLTDFQAVLSTQLALLSVQDGVAASRAEAASALIRLYKALGGGWAPAATAEPQK